MTTVRAGRSLAVLIALLLSSRTALAGNLLVNPGFEANPAGQTQTMVAWWAYGNNGYSETGAGIAHNGTNYYKAYQAFTGTVNYTGIYQDNLSGPGAVYSADGWACTSATDRLAGQNCAWIEVSFRDAGVKMLALYRSALITTNAIATGAFPLNSWVHLAVTNQYDPTTFQFVRPVSKLVAPAGTSFVRYQLLFQGDARSSGGSVYFDDLSLAQTAGAPHGDWSIVWNDEFNGPSINTNIWTFDIGNGSSGWENNELEYYTSSPQNVCVSNGLLHIIARQQSNNGFAYTSARLKTQGLFSRAYGRIEFRAQLPHGLGFWPAFWLLGTNITSVGWPACGEIDVMENNGTNLTTVQGSLHSGSDETQIYILPEDVVTNFHTYTLEWTTNAFDWFVDGLLYQTQTSWSSSGSVGPFPAPFNQPFFLVMNLAVGGNYVGNPSISTINANATFPAEMQVDYLRIYDHADPLAITITRDGSNVNLTWPTGIVCHLQTRADRTPASGPSDWVDLAEAPNPLVVPATNEGGYYRLASP